MRRALFAAAVALAGCDTGPDRPQPEIASVDGLVWGMPSNLPSFFDCLREHGGTLISAHRGGPARGYAENAIPTFEQTTMNAPAWLEVDVARTRDGVLVLMHDDSVDRTTNGAGEVRALTASQFGALLLRDGDGNVIDFHPPTLRAALGWARDRAILELDVKRGVSYEDVAREVRDANAMSRVVFITYSVDGASRLSRAAPEAMIYTTIADIRDLDTLARRGVDLTHIVAWLGDEDLDRDLLAALNARGVEARWGLFGANADFAAAARTGVQGVAVNDPLAAYRAIDAADGEEGYAAVQCAAAG